MLLDDPTALDLEYTRTMMGFLLFVPQPRDIVMIGLGGGSIAKFCHRHLRRARIRVVEVNPHVIALRDEFRVPPDDGRFSVVRADAARFVRDSTQRCDALLVDGFDSGGQPDALCSQRFYDDCRALLQPGGVAAINLHYGHPHHAIHVERIRRSFDDAVLVVDDGEASNSIVFACQGGGLDRARFPAQRQATDLAAAAADPLREAFALIASALRDRRPAQARNAA